MRFALLALILAGCAHADIAVNAGAPPPPAPQAALQVSASGGPALVLVAAVLVMAAFQKTADSAAALMAPDRSINEQDCTRPVESAGNLRCR